MANVGDKLLLETLVQKKSDTLGLWHQRFLRMMSSGGKLMMAYWLSREQAETYPHGPRAQYDLTNCKFERKGVTEVVIINAIAVTRIDDVIYPQVNQGFNLRFKSSARVSHSIETIIRQSVAGEHENWHHHAVRKGSFTRFARKGSPNAINSVLFSDVYCIKEEIGRGGFATVFKAIQRETGQVFAVKRVTLSAYQDEERKERAMQAIDSEIKIMAIINKVFPDNPNLLHLKGVFEESVLEDDELVETEEKDVGGEQVRVIDVVDDDELSVSPTPSPRRKSSSKESKKEKKRSKKEKSGKSKKSKSSKSKSKDKRDKKGNRDGDEESSRKKRGKKSKSRPQPALNEYVYIVMDLMTGGELFDRIVERSKYSERDAAQVFRKLVHAVRALHKVGIVHRDLKPENIIFESQGEDSELKLADYGAAYVMGREDEDIHRNQRVGSPGYHAPEVYRNKYGPEGDVWSLGVILYVLLVGYPPFDGENEAELMMKVMTGSYEFEKEHWEGLSEEAKQLVKGMIVVAPKKRLTMDQVANHPWLKKNTFTTSEQSDLISRMRTFNTRRKFRSAAFAVTGATRVKVQQHVMRAVLAKAVAQVASSYSSG